MKKLLLFLSLLIFGTIYSQQWAWARQADFTTSHQKAIDICTDHIGNVFVIGENLDTAIYGSTILNSGCFVAKYSSSGTLLWAKKLPGEIKGVVCDNAGNVELIGQFTNTVHIGSFTLTSNGLVDIYLTKINSSGIIYFAKSFGGIKNDIAKAISIDRSDNIFITGTFQDSIHFDNYSLVDVQTNKNINQLFYLVKLSPSGQTLWAKTCPYNYSGNSYQYQSTSFLKVDKNGSAYITGEYCTVPCYDYCNGYFIAKYDGGGNMQLNSRTWDCYSFISGLAVDDSLNILVEYHTGSHYTSAIGLSKYDSLMNLEWHQPVGAYQYGTNYTFCSGLSVDKQCNIYLAGFFGFSNQDQNDTTLNFCSQMAYSKGESDVVLGKFSPAGNCVWIKTAGGKGAEDYYGTGQLFVDQNGNCFMAGNYHVNIQYVTQVQNEAVIFDADTLHNDGNWQQIYVAKLNAFNPIPTLTLLNNTDQQVQIFPNPTSEYLSLTTADVKGRYKTRLYNITGESLLTSEYLSPTLQLDLRSYPKGIYFLELETEKGKVVKKIILQ